MHSFTISIINSFKFLLKAGVIPDKCTNACLINKSGDEIYCTDPPFTSIFDTGNDSFKSLEKKYPIKVEKVTYYKKYFKFIRS